MTGNRIGVELYADVSQYNSAMKKAQSEADSIEQKLGSEVVDAANRAERALNSISGNVSAKINIDDSEIVTAQSALDDLNAETASVTIDVQDGELVTAQGQIDDINSEAPSVTVDVDDTELKNTLDTLKLMSAVEIALNFTSNIDSIAGKIPGLAGVFEQDEALRIIEAGTLNDLEGANQLLNDLFLNFGLARTEGARFIVSLSNAGTAEADLNAVATSTLNAQKAIEGITGETIALDQILKSQKSLVELGFADSFTAASDVIVAGFQSTIGISGDFLGDLGEFAPTFATLGFTSEQMLNTLETGLAGGVDNISRMSEGLISFNELASGADENFIAALTSIDNAVDSNLLAQMDLFQAGELSGADFMSGVLDGARAFSAQEGQTAAQGILGSIFGGTASNIGAQALLNVDPNADEFKPLENRAQAAADTMRDSLKGAMDEFFRFVDVEAVEFLSSEQIDLDGKINALKEGLGVAIAAIEDGATIPEALEIGLNIPGFADSVTRFESGVGNFLIAALELIAGVQDFAGKDSTGTRAEITRLAEGQLAFDLKVANPEEIDTVVATALSRGVSGEALAANIGVAVDELLGSGDIAGAQALIDQFNEIPAAIVRTTSTLFPDMNETLQVSFDPEVESPAEFQARLQAQVDEIQNTVGGVNATVEFIDVDTEAIAAIAQTVDEASRAAQLAAQTAAADTGGAFANSIISGMEAENIQERMTSLLDIEGQMEGGTFDAMSGRISQIGEQLAAIAPPETEGGVPPWVTGFQEGITTSLTEVSTAATDTETAFVASLQGMVETSEYADERIGEALTGNTITEDIRAVATQAMISFPIAGAAMFSFGLMTPVYLEPAKQALLALRSIVAGLGELVGNTFSSMNQNLAQAATLATAAKATIEGAAAAQAASGGGGAGSASPNAQGGPFGAGDPLLFEGSSPEIITFNQPGSVIGIRDTRSILDAVTALASGTLGAPVTNQTSTRNISVVNNNVVQSLPQAELVSQRTATAIRGF